MKFSYKGLKFESGWKEFLILGLVLLSLLGKEMLWPSLSLPAIQRIFDWMDRPDYDATALNDLDLLDSEGIYTFQNVNREILHLWNQ